MTALRALSFVDGLQEFVKNSDWKDYERKVCLIANITCRDTIAGKFFENLNKLNKKYKKDGLRILLFPCFQFGPEGSKEEIVKAISDKMYDVGDIFDPVEVNGEHTPRLFQYLKKQRPGKLGPVITENFTYFILDRNGKVNDRLPSNTSLYVLDDLIFQLL